MSIVIKKYKRLVKELLFAHSELEYVEEVLKEAHSDFELYYQAFCREKGVPLKELNEKNSKRIEEVYPKKEVKTDQDGTVQIKKTEQDKQEHKIFQRMYRIVAKKLHPDKFANQEQTSEVLEKIDAFKQATNAYDKRNWAIFLDICEKYDILPTRYEKITSLIRQEIINVEKKVDNKKLSFSWRLYECEEDPACMDQVIEAFLYQLFRYQI